MSVYLLILATRHYYHQPYRPCAPSLALPILLSFISQFSSGFLCFVAISYYRGLVYNGNYYFVHLSRHPFCVRRLVWNLKWKNQLVALAYHDMSWVVVFGEIRKGAVFIFDGSWRFVSCCLTGAFVCDELGRCCIRMGCLGSFFVPSRVLAWW